MVFGGKKARYHTCLFLTRCRHLYCLYLRCNSLNCLQVCSTRFCVYYSSYLRNITTTLGRNTDFTDSTCSILWSLYQITKERSPHCWIASRNIFRDLYARVYEPLWSTSVVSIQYTNFWFI